MTTAFSSWRLDSEEKAKLHVMNNPQKIPVITIAEISMFAGLLVKPVSRPAKGAVGRTARVPATAHPHKTMVKLAIV